MVAGIDKFLLREIEESISKRESFWHRDFSSPEAYDKSIEPNRERLRRMIGAVDERAASDGFIGIDLALKNLQSQRVKVGEAADYDIFAVRWRAFGDVFGDGLLLHPKRPSKAAIIALPDADQTPEMLIGLEPGVKAEAQFPRRLAEAGCEVLVPALIDRRDLHSGSERLKRFTNQPHREWIYRQAYELGRHIIGYEVLEVMAAIDAMAKETGGDRNVGVIGYGEGGSIAFYAAALDTRIQAALVSGYFDSRQRVWEEPIYRNVSGLLREFGDAEIAGMIAPRRLIIEHSDAPRIDGPPAPRQGRAGAAPGKIAAIDFNRAEMEVARARKLVGNYADRITLIHGNEGRAIGPGSDEALQKFLAALNLTNRLATSTSAAAHKLLPGQPPELRQEQMVKNLVDHTQDVLRWSENTRKDFFWNKLKATPTNDWTAQIKPFQNIFWNDVIGKFTNGFVALNPRSRKILETPKWTAYEIVLDVWPDVFAWGDLLVPKDLRPGEKRPLVVCQHGLEGVPEDTITVDPKARGYAAYKGFTARLAEEGFITFAPHNPYRGLDKFRVLQRKANPLGKTLFSIIIGQHDQELNWLSSLPFVDPARMAFYGLSYGGKTAMRVPSVLDRYCLSICSGDFNEWVKKNATVESTYSYMFTFEYEMPEFNLGSTFNYAEMAALVAPRPFMVERGHNDGVAPDEWVAYEFSKVRRLYDQLGIGDRTEIEFFSGPHTINGMGTFQFLHRHLNFPTGK